MDKLIFPFLVCVLLIIGGIVSWRESYKVYHPNPTWKALNKYTLSGDILFGIATAIIVSFLQKKPF